MDIQIQKLPAGNPSMSNRPTREELQQRVRELEEQLETQAHVLENMVEGVHVTDENGIIIFTNPMFDATLGYKHDELIGKHISILDALTPEESEQFATEFAAQMSTKGYWQGEVKTKRKDGTQDTSIARITELESAGKKRWVSVQENNAERRRMEIRLRNSEIKSRAWLENSPVCTKIVDLDFNLQYMSSAGIRSLGIEDITEFYGRPYPFDFYPESFRSEMAHNLEKARATGIIITQEASVVDIEGKELWFHSTLVPVANEEGLVDYIIVVSIDVTERKLAEQAVRESAEKLRCLNRDLELRIKQRTAQLEEANDELKGFVYSVSHDLRAPLRSMQGFTELLDRKHKASLNEEAQEYLSFISDASKQLSELIDDLLAYSRLGHSAMKPEPVPLHDVFESAVGALSAQIEEAGAKVNLPSHLPVIQGTLTLTKHVFINVLENAIKYHKPGITPIVDITHETEGQTVVVSIADNGIGIEPQYQETIFSIFKRLHGQDEYPGTGIGLASVRKALQIMKGQIHVESALGRGSVFRIEMPIEHRLD